MPKRVSELTALQLKSLKNGVHNVGGVKGLYFKKTNTQARFFSGTPMFPEDTISL
ncbi:hypothetical protein [uncultured Parasutterella sp.]|uniref:hypothetical protein n=1 Tax=uncultured Parasutterella sp. TaxID=1263098 RepID=UPI00261FA9B3|nr:hypothetical protein [uncultured Parasutterella sp.]